MGVEMESDVPPRNGLDVAVRIAEEKQQWLRSESFLRDISLGWRRRYYSALIGSKGRKKELHNGTVDPRIGHYQV